MKKLKTNELGRLSIEAYKKTAKIPVIVVFDNIRSMHNVGSIFRTCDAFNIQKVILCGITPVPPHREINKTALGATESVAWEYNSSVVNAIEKLQSTSYQIVGLEQADQSIPINQYIAAKDENIALVIGNEVSGLSDEIMEMLDICLEIPQYGTKHSLNVSVAAGILIYEVCRSYFTIK